MEEGVFERQKDTDASSVIAENGTSQGSISSPLLFSICDGAI